MAEIKSAFELAMEKSKKYAISDEEREKIKEKEVLQKATGLFHRYKDGHLSSHEMVKEIERMDERTRERVRKNLLSQWVDALSLEEDSGRFLHAIESVKGRSLDDIKERFQNLLSAYRGEIEKARQGMSIQLTEALRRDGIYGDAVEPNVEESEQWKKLVESANCSCQGKLDEIKRALMES
ncbi:MAG TPA: hypothetical protein VLK23_09365 [Thermodesulfobacteriota bacterium]|nr:hypothetical protein [Thermodesulfobacteriota bacterium]